MSTELMEKTGQGIIALTARDIRAQVNLIQEVMKAVMKEGTHFGIIPGCPKPSLFKPGAEKIAVTFRIAVKSVVEDLSTTDEKRYRVTCTAFALDGSVLGSSTGECSSDEAKYRWRRPVCEQEFVEADGDRKREKWVNGKTGATKVKQIRTEIADIANTILQMADKRAYVAVVRKVTAASDVFTSDIEDLPPEVQADMMEGQTAPAGKPAVAMPTEKDTAYSDIITLSQGKVGDVLNVSGYGISVKHRIVGTKKSDITDFIIGDLPTDPTMQVEISAWGKLDAGAGEKIKFHAVEIGDYKGAKKFLAKEGIVHG